MMRRNAFILPVILFTVLLIALVGATYSFRIHSDHAATAVMSEQLQSRLAAEAGVEWVKAFLRAGADDPADWWHSPDAFHRVVVWAEGEDSTAAGTTDEFDTDKAYRFSIVADDPADDETYIRFGLTDEASKLNLNTATEAQLRTLVTSVLGETEDLDPLAIVDAILDWRDSDTQPRGETGDTEGPYYRALAKPYRVKNGPFDTVEELLLVKGVTPRVLYGEDFDRNGLMTDNENDGDLSFPPDNQDGVLNRGLYPYLTTISRERDVARSNRQRVYLFGPEEVVRAELTEMFPDDPTAVDFIVSATRSGGGQSPNGEGSDQGNRPQGPGGQNGPGGRRPGADGPGRAGPRTGSMSDGAPPVRGEDKPPPEKSIELPGDRSGGGGLPSEGDKRAVQSQRRDDVPPNTDNPAPGSGDAGEAPEDTADPGNSQGPGGDGGSETDEEADADPAGEGGTGDGEPGTSPIRSPADLMLPRKIGEDLVPSPLLPEQLEVLMDRTTVRSPDEEKEIEGLININTAPRQVLECIEGLSAEQIDTILAARDRLEPSLKSTPAWLLVERVLEPEGFAGIAPQLTARSQQFTIESVGYADHHGMVTRLQVVVDMLGPIAQTVYYRDISYLGASYPIREDDLEQQRAR